MDGEPARSPGYCRHCDGRTLHGLVIGDVTGASGPGHVVVAHDRCEELYLSRLAARRAAEAQRA